MDGTNAHCLAPIATERSSLPLRICYRTPLAIWGARRQLRSDNGPEFVGAAVLERLAEVGIDTAFIAPGTPWQNGNNESFNVRFRDERLDIK